MSKTKIQAAYSKLEPAQIIMKLENQNTFG